MLFVRLSKELYCNIEMESYTLFILIWLAILLRILDILEVVS